MKNTYIYLFNSEYIVVRHRVSIYILITDYNWPNYILLMLYIFFYFTDFTQLRSFACLRLVLIVNGVA